MERHSISILTVRTSREPCDRCLARFLDRDQQIAVMNVSEVNPFPLKRQS